MLWIRLVNNKISEISLKRYSVSFNNSYQQQTRIAHAWLQINCQNSLEMIRQTSNIWGAMLKAYHKLHPKPKSIAEHTEALQAIWDKEPINKAVKSITLRHKRCTKADDEQFENTKWLSDIRQSVHRVVSMTLFCCVSTHMFFSTRQPLRGYAKISITSSYLKIIKCHLAVKCKQDSHVNV